MIDSSNSGQGVCTSITVKETPWATKQQLKNLLMLSQVREIVPYSASHIWRLERLGQFPRRIRLGGNRVAWLQSEVNSWVDGKIALRTSDKD